MSNGKRAQVDPPTRRPPRRCRPPTGRASPTSMPWTPLQSGAKITRRRTSGLLKKGRLINAFRVRIVILIKRSSKRPKSTLAQWRLTHKWTPTRKYLQLRRTTVWSWSPHPAPLSTPSEAWSRPNWRLSSLTNLLPQVSSSKAWINFSSDRKVSPCRPRSHLRFKIS